MATKTVGPASGPGTKPGAGPQGQRAAPQPAAQPPEAAATPGVARAAEQTALAPRAERAEVESRPEDAIPDAARFPVLAGVGVDIITLGKTLARSGFFSDVKQVSQAIVKVLAGQELGIGPIRAMTDIHVLQVEGRTQVALGAALMAALIKRSGRYDYRITRHDDEGCVIEFYEKAGPDKWESRGTSSFTMEDARKANLAGKANWRLYPRNMHFARAMSNGAKWFCGDVFGGAVYTPEELREAAFPEEVANGGGAEPAPEPEAPAPAPAAAPARPSGRLEDEPLADPTAEDEGTRKAREMTMTRIYGAMERAGMKAEDMRSLARMVYRREPEQMPVDMLALLAGRVEDIAAGKGLGGPIGGEGGRR